MGAQWAVAQNLHWLVTFVWLDLKFGLDFQKSSWDSSQAAAEPNDIEHPQLKPDERDLIALNQIITYHGRYYAVIHSSRRSEDPKIPGLWATGLAVSPDLIHWTKSPDGPLRPLSENKSSGLLIPDGPEFLLYTMHGKVDLHRSHIK